jgi:hypothetical protein
MRSPLTTLSFFFNEIPDLAPNDAEFLNFVMVLFQDSCYVSLKVHCRFNTL